MARLHYSMLQAVLDGDIDDNDTTITFTAPLKEWGEDNIATISGGDTLALRVGYELMHITAYTSGASTATVARGQEGSTATAHSEGDVMRHVLTDNDVPDFSTFAPLASPTFTGEPVAPSLKVTGKTGATATPIRLAGGTASGAPTTGAHLKGEIIFDDTGVGYYCTVAGTPGTWVSFGGGGGGGGSVATDSIWDAAGDLVYGTGSDAATRLALGAALRVLRVNAGATAPEWADLSTLYAPLNAAGTLLGTTHYNPGSDSELSATTTMADVDASNAKVDFVVPPSGKVLIEASMLGYNNGTAGYCFVGLREASSDLSGTKRAVLYYPSNLLIFNVDWVITGLTPGASKTYKLAFQESASGDFRLQIGPNRAPITMKAWASP